MVDSLPKTIWLSTHYIPSDEELASPQEMAHDDYRVCDVKEKFW